MTDNARIDDLVQRLRAELTPERYEEIMSKGWDVAIVYLFEEWEAGNGRSDLPRLIYESWMLDGKNALIEEAADALARRSIQDQPEAVADQEKLVAFFNTPVAYARWGHDGDHDELTPAETAIRALEQAEATFESIRLALINHLNEPERTAFWAAVHGRDAIRSRSVASAPPPIAGAGWKPAAEFAPPDDDYWQMAVREIERAGKGLHHAHLTNHHAATLLYWANLARDAYRASPVPDNTDARAAQDSLLTGEGFVYFNEDSGEEYSPNHPVESGECEDATDVRRSTPQEDTLNAALQTEFTRAEAAEAKLAAIIPGTDASGVIEQLREALKPFATTAEQLDRPLPSARNGRVTIVHPLDDVVPELRGTTDHECPEWPLPDDMEIISAWRYHDPVPLSEHIVIQMVHLRAARDVLASLAVLDPVKAPKP